jgi:hypothetical protein
MLYTDKSKEELDAILHNFVLKFSSVFGYFNKNEIISKLNELIELKKQQQFESVFNTLTPKSLDQIIQMLKTPEKHVENQKVKKAKNTIPSNPIMTKK